MTRIRKTYLSALAVLLSPMAANAEIIYSYDLSVIGPDIELTGRFTSNVASGYCYTPLGCDGNTNFTLGGTISAGPGGPPVEVLITIDSHLRLDLFEIGGIPDPDYPSSIFSGIPFNGYELEWSFDDVNPQILLWNFIPSFDANTALWRDSGLPLFNGPIILWQLYCSRIPGTQNECYPHIWEWDGSGETEFLTQVYVSASVPEPGTLALLTLGLLGIGLTRKR